MHASFADSMDAIMCYTSESAPPGALCPRDVSDGQVGEWLKPTDCKSVPPCEVRRFESFPVHHPAARRLSEHFSRHYYYSTAADNLSCRRHRLIDYRTSGL